MQIKSKMSGVKCQVSGVHGGFTLVELLVVIGVSVILAAAVAPVYGNLQVGAQVDAIATEAVQYLRTARTQSVARLNALGHGVYFDLNSGSDDRMILYTGPSYAGRTATYDRIETLDSALSFSYSGFTLTGTDIDVNFSKGLGMPDNTGTLTITHSTQGSKSVIVNGMGTVEQ
jgi:prepilin-type N-terminal cleavage/methylation domain-containing protein